MFRDLCSRLGCTWILIVVFMLMCILTKAKTHADPQIDKETCQQNTFYIQEYHNHGVNSSEAGIPQDVTSFTGDNSNEKMRIQISELEKELALERSKRVQQLSDLLLRMSQWTQPRSRSSMKDVSKEMKKALKDMNKMMTERNEDKPKKSLDSVTERALGDQEDLKIKVNVTPHGDKDDGSAKKAKSSESKTLKQLQQDMQDLTKEMGSFHKQHIHLYKSHRRLASRERALRGKHDRLKIFTNSHLQLLTQKVKNETAMWREKAGKVEEFLNCVQNPGLPHCKFPKGSSPTQLNQKAPWGALNPDGMPSPISGVMHTNGNKGVQNDENVVADEGALVSAGQLVSEWYMEQVRAERPKDCADLDHWQQREKPIQTVYLRNRTFPVRVRCEEGWTIIYSFKFDASSFDEAPERTLEDYKYGYGSMTSNLMWMGLEYIHWLSSQDDYYLQVQMVRARDGQKIHAHYSYFDIAAKEENYVLQASDYSGTSGDILGYFAASPITGSPFSSPVHARDAARQAVATEFKSGWWYPEGEFVKKRNGQPSPCFTHLIHETPWYCDEDFQPVYVREVVMKLKPATKTY